ncbi:UvrD-helicase domain-containing protein [Erysipelotrichaceae bacterium OttesenSCG-928-M19]|nr:UvrD-helicase domain-containing protein [Erysipelotrichaceae bacterium OttesenSCG-928-M19]
MMDLTMFNSQQQEAITSKEPYIKVIAGAGSGKTAVLTNRIVYLIKERQVKERNILAITFTNKAAKEMKERVLQLLDKEVFLGLITTFHSFCLRVLKEDINVLGYTKDFNIIDSDDQKSILKNINKRLNYDKDVFQVKGLVAYISNEKNHYYPQYLDEKTKKVYDEFYLEYQKYLKDNNSLDFDDLIILCVKLFKEYPLILDKWRFRFNYLHVDEFQDTNYQQYELIKLLGIDLNVFVVGDPDQTIYTWRGAKIDYILNFENDFKPTQVIMLEYNYRSQKHILECANSLIINNSDRIEKKLIPTRESEELVEHFIGEKAEDEANFVVDKINELIAEVPDVNYDDFAILYRSNYISRIFEQHLTSANIDYQIIGGTRFFERKEVKDIIAYLKVIASNDNLSFLRIVNVPKRKMGEKSVEKIVLYSLAKQISYYEAIRDNLTEIGLSATQKQLLSELVAFIEEMKDEDNAAKIIESVLLRFNVLEEYAPSSIDYQTRYSNLEELLNYANSIPKSLDEFLQDISLDSTNEDGGTGAKVSLMSMHAAKGLEFKYVFAVFLNDGVFPSSYSLETLNLEEERRLAYVCFTRAKDQLFLVSHLYNNSYQGYYTTSSSMFVKEIDDDLMKKGGRFKQDHYLEPQVNEMNLFKAQKNDEESEYEINDVIMHPNFKKGVIIAINDNILTIAFENKVGIKQIVKDFVKKI